MAVFSSFARVFSHSKHLLASKPANYFLSKNQNAFIQAFRKMSDHERTMHITPSRFQYSSFKDDLHFYITLGVVPMALFILCVNIFIGSATLTEIPEDYEPEYWEYHKHPIKRFIARHFHDSPEVRYERVLHYLNEEQERLEWKLKTEKAKSLMALRDDYKGPYFIPVDLGRQYRFARKEEEISDTFAGYK